MSIERLGPIDPLSAYSKNQKTQRADQTAKGDSVLVSEEARAKAELLKISEAVRGGDEVRMDRVEEAKKKLEDPSYINDSVLSKTADNILDLFGL